MLEVCDRLRSFACPALVIWGTRGPRAAARPRPAAGGIPAKRAARRDPDSYTLIMRDRPAAFASAVREFVRRTTGPEPVADTT
jgi:pimeloyl-ACP methyl ester carboxylesterase